MIKQELKQMHFFVKGVLYSATTPTTWWSNPIFVVSACTALATSGRVNVINSNLSCSSNLGINGSNISLFSSLTNYYIYTGTSSPNFDVADGSNFTWVEMRLRNQATAGSSNSIIRGSYSAVRNSLFAVNNFTKCN